VDWSWASCSRENGGWGVDVVGRMAEMAAGGVEGRERASATTFCEPGVCEGVNANSEMNAS